MSDLEPMDEEEFEAVGRPLVARYEDFTERAMAFRQAEGIDTTEPLPEGELREEGFELQVAMTDLMLRRPPGLLPNWATWPTQ